MVRATGASKSQVDDSFILKDSHSDSSDTSPGPIRVRGAVRRDYSEVCLNKLAPCLRTAVFLPLGSISHLPISPPLVSFTSNELG